MRTDWHTSDIWLRREVELAQAPTSPHLMLYHDEDCEVYVNGKLVASATGYTTGYVLIPVTDPGVFQAGKNLIAVHCHQTSGGQGIDVGIVDVRDAPD